MKFSELLWWDISLRVERDYVRKITQNVYFFFIQNLSLSNFLSLSCSVRPFGLNFLVRFWFCSGAPWSFLVCFYRFVVYFKVFLFLYFILFFFFANGYLGIIYKDVPSTFEVRSNFEFVKVTARRTNRKTRDGFRNGPWRNAFRAKRHWFV